MMPKGVEHEIKTMGIEAEFEVKISMMPKGVEHKAYIEAVIRGC